MLPTCSTVPDVKPAVSAADCLSVNLSKQGYPGPILISAVLLPAAKTAGFKVKGGTGFGVSTLIKLAQEM